MPSRSGNGPPLRPIQRKRVPKMRPRSHDKVPGKVDDGMRKLNGIMFEPVSTLIQWKDTIDPAINHPSRMAVWQTAVEEEIDEAAAAADIGPEEQVSAAAAGEIGLALMEKFLAAAGSVGWASQSPEERLAAAELVLRSPQVPQRTPAWYLQGKQVLTASEFATLYGSPRAVGQMVMSKVPPSEPVVSLSTRLACCTSDMGPFDWGVRFEPVVKQVLASKWGAVIAESGRIMHPTDSNLAASPDGFIMAATDEAKVGRLLEIKCPIRRAIGEGVPFEYWCQMQIQMEVTGIGECEYVEVKFDSVEKGKTDLSGEPEGYIWLLQNPETCELRYIYTVQERAELDAWAELEKIPWRLGGFYSEVVTRDRNWFASTADLRAGFWSNVAAARAGGFEVPVGRSKPKGLAVTVVKEGCQIVD